MNYIDSIVSVHRCVFVVKNGAHILAILRFLLTVHVSDSGSVSTHSGCPSGLM